MRGNERRRMDLSLKEIGERFARWASPADIPDELLTGVSTDSRRVNAGELFVALKGDNFDGHRFVQSALDNGALAALVSQSWFDQQGHQFKDAPLLLARDTLTAYQEMARYYRRKLSPRVVALTGSAGKTTCKEYIYSVLSQKFSVLRNIKSFNNHVGVPATLLQLEPNHEILVAELGTSGFGEIARLSELVEPDVCLLLNIGYAHLQQLKSRDGIARAKMEIFAHASSEAVAIINADDDILTQQTYPTRRKITFGVEQNADLCAVKTGCDASGCYHFELGGENVQLTIPGRHNIYNALAAAAVGIHFDVPMKKIKRALESVQQVEHRMSVMLARGLIIIDDAYNANPGSCRAALETAADIQVPAGGRRIAVLADMLELGGLEESEHLKLADAAIEYGIDALFLYGNSVKATAARARKIGLFAEYFPDQEQLSAALKKYALAGDLILVKGSRSMHMERVVDALKAEKE